MFLEEYTRRQSGSVVSCKNRDHRLREDFAMIKFRRHHVHGGARKPAASVNSALVCIEPGECRQQRWMDVDQASCIVRHETASEDAHEAGKRDQCGFVLIDSVLQRKVKRIARFKLFVVQHCGLKAH